uniref:Ig-like domain-containing protein n=1 Tax=Macrostomum lignano TaxID=282301 RepID=A0A1I8FC41_9PLAT
QSTRASTLSSRRELAIRNLSYATLGLYHCYARRCSPGTKLFSREPRPVLPEGADEAAASDLVELKAEFPASFAVTWYRFTDIGLERQRNRSPPLTPTCSGSATTCCSGRAAGAAFATRMNLLGGRVTFGYFFMCHGVDLAAKRMGYYVYQIIPARAPAFSELDNFEPPLSRVSNRPSRQRFFQRVYLNVSGDTVAGTPPPPAGRRCPPPSGKDPGGVAVAADGSLVEFAAVACGFRDAKPEDSGVYDLLLSNQAGRASAQLHLLVSTPPLLSKVNQTIAANESSVLFIDCLQRATPSAAARHRVQLVTAWTRRRQPQPRGHLRTAGADFFAYCSCRPSRPACTLENGRLIIHNLSVDASGQLRLPWPSPACPSGAPFWSSRTKSSPGTPPAPCACGVIPGAAALSQSGQHGVRGAEKPKHVIDCPWSGLGQPSIALVPPVPERRRLPTSVGVELSKNNTRLTIHMSDPEFSGSYLIQANSSSQGTVTKHFSIRGGPPAGVRPHQPEPHGDPRRLGVAATDRASGSPPPLISWTLRRPAGARPSSTTGTNSRPVRAPARGSCCSRNGSLLIQPDVADGHAGNYHLPWLGTPFRVAQVRIA